MPRLQHCSSDTCCMSILDSKDMVVGSIHALHMKRGKEMAMHSGIEIKQPTVEVQSVSLWHAAHAHLLKPAKSHNRLLICKWQRHQQDRSHAGAGITSSTQGESSFVNRICLLTTPPDRGAKPNTQTGCCPIPEVTNLRWARP